MTELSSRMLSFAPSMAITRLASLIPTCRPQGSNAHLLPSLLSLGIPNGVKMSRGHELLTDISPGDGEWVNILLLNRI